MSVDIAEKKLSIGLKIGIYGFISAIIIGIVIYLSLFSVKALSSVLMLLFPMILAILFDYSSGRYVTIVIGMCNLSGILLCGPTILTISEEYNNINQVIDQILNSNVMLIVYSLSGIGFLIAVVVPELFTVTYIGLLRMKNDSLKKKLQKFNDKWMV